MDRVLRSAILNSNVIDVIQDNKRPFDELMSKYRCAIILVGHLNKAQGNKSNYRGLGSIDFQATARSVLVVGRVKDKPEVRVAAHQKSSLAPEGKPIAFELSEANGFRWLGHYDILIEMQYIGRLH